MNNDQLADRIAIGDVLNLHSRGLDRADADQLADCYWEDATVDYGIFRGAAQEFVPLVIGALQQNYRLTRHALQNTLYRFDGDQCHTETLVSAHHLYPDGDRDLHYLGRYLDRFTRRDGRWRLQHRQVISDWVRDIPFQNLSESPQFADITRSGRGADDPAHALFSHGAAND